jgi:ABC-2 type transport system ATP-binding protein
MNFYNLWHSPKTSVMLCVKEQSIALVCFLRIGGKTMTFFEVTDLSKNYKQKCALNHVSFHVNSAEIVALIGKNGAGKTTLLNCIAGNITPTTGSIRYKDTNLLQENSLLNEFGILIQASFFDYLNAYDNLALLMEASGIRDKNAIKVKANKTLDLVGLAEKKHAYVKSFSFGMKQRLGLAQTLIHDPQFLILDEPFVGLDPIGKEMLKNVIIQKSKKENAGVLFSSHDLYDVSEICDRVVMFDEGKKVFDDVFVYMKTYNIVCRKPIPDTLKSTFISNFAGKIEFTDNGLKFVEVNLLDKIISYLVSNQIGISDIRVKENSLYDYFKKEVSE